MKIDRDYLFSTLADLIRINSINPTLAAAGHGEAEIASMSRRRSARIGLDVPQIRAGARPRHRGRQPSQAPAADKA